MRFRGLLQAVVAVLLVFLSGVEIACGQTGKTDDDLRHRWEGLSKQAVEAFLAEKYIEAESIAREALQVAEETFGPDHIRTAISLQKLAAVLQVQGHYSAAEPLSRRALTIFEKSQTATPYTFDKLASNTFIAHGASNLASILVAQERYSEAEPLYRRTLAIWEVLLGANHPNTASSLNNLAYALDAQGRYGEAEPLYRRALAIREDVLGSDHPDTATSLNNLASVLSKQGRYEDAEPLYRRALAIWEEVLGAKHLKTATSLNNLASVLSKQGRYGEAESLHRRVLAIREDVLGSDHPDTATSLNNLASVLSNQGRYGDAEPLFRRALAICEMSGTRPLDTAGSLNNLAYVLDAQGRYGEAEPLYRRALTIWEGALGTNHPDIASGLNNLAAVLDAQGRYKEAEPLYRRALVINKEVLGANHPDTARSLNNLASVLSNQKRYEEAEPLYRRALAIKEEVFGGNHNAVASSLNNLASTLSEQGRYEEAELLHRRALAIREQALGANHPDTASSLNNLATVLHAQGDYEKANRLFRRAVTLNTESLSHVMGINANLGAFLVERSRPAEALPHYRTAIDALDRLFAYTQGLSDEARHTFLGQHAYIYRDFLQLLLDLHQAQPQAGHDREFLAVASRNQSRLFSELLRQADVQTFADDPDFTALKDQRQDLFNQLSALREKRATIADIAPNADGQRADLSARIARLDTELKTLETRLWADYPRFMELLQPRPVTVERLQQDLLQPGEALLSIVLLENHAVLLAVTRDRYTLHAEPLARADLGEQLRTLRRPFEAVAARGDTAPLGQLDPAVLHRLYQHLIAPVEPVLQGANHIFVIADGPLYSLPLELLITAYDEPLQRAFRSARRRADGSGPDRPLFAEYAALPYLGDRFRFRYLPSLAALASQRTYPLPTVPHRRSLIAFADPVFGPEQTGDPAPAEPAATPTVTYTPATQHTLALLTRSGLSRVETLQRLPDSADEARALATQVGGDPALYLRHDAQEHTVKTLAQAGAFHGLRYLLFATHGLLGGDFLPPEPEPPAGPITLDRLARAAPPDPKGQPALVLTLQGDLHGEDGFLTLQDVLQTLTLNTELVILSACNSAGDSAQAATGEGFAGLTRAFLFAGARHLWVSHWPVHSTATRDLITAAVQARETDPLPPDQALAAAQQHLRATPLDLGGLYLSRAHPYFWAPFVTVGD